MIYKNIIDYRNKKRNLLFLDLVKTHKLRIFISIVCMIVMAMTTASLPWMIKPVLEDIFMKQDELKLNFLPLLIIVIYVLRSLSMYGQEYHSEYIGQNFINNLRNKLYHSIIYSSAYVFEKKKIGKLMSSITYDVSIIKNMVSIAIAGSIRDVLTILFLLIVIFYRNYYMAVFAFMVLPVAVFPMIKFGRKIRIASIGVQDSMADLNSFLYETFVGNKTIKAFTMEKIVDKRFKKKSQQIFLIEIKNIIAKAITSPTMELLGGIAISFVIWSGGYQVIAKKLEPGSFFSFVGAVIMLYDPVKKLTRVNNFLQEGMAALNRVFGLIELKSEFDCKGNVAFEDGLKCKVEFKNVYFDYMTTRILKNISFVINPGETVAIVGRSGTGKTSIINLIPRFYELAKGNILINSVDIYKVSLTSLRKQISVVPQDPMLFNISIGDNISYGKIGASKKEIEQASKDAYAYDFIQNLPKKFETLVGEFGHKLSGGEKQRICIARAFLKNKPILILDEATSSLDTTSEIFVQKALKSLMLDKTTFIIAHKLSTIINSNRILVVSNGTIIEDGNHRSLIKKRGEYYKLYVSQFRY